MMNAYTDLQILTEVGAEGFYVDQRACEMFLRKKVKDG